MWPFSGVCWDQVASTVSTKCPSSSGTTFPHVAQEPPGPHFGPGDLPFPPEHHQVLSCRVADFALPLFTFLMEFKPSPFSFLLSPFLVVSLWLFPIFQFLSSCFWEGCFYCILSIPASLCPLSAHKKTSLPAPSCSPSSPLRAVYLLNSGGSGCADCCVNTPISFLGL